MGTTQTIDPSAFFEEFMASMSELRKFQEESAQSRKETERLTDRLMEESAQSRKETDRLMAESAQSRKETDRLMAESAQIRKETERLTERLMEESAQRRKEIDSIFKEVSRKQEETAQQIKETGKQLGKLGNRFGEMIEYMVVPNLEEKFHEFGFEFEQTHRDTVIRSHKHNIFTEVDVSLENGDKVMIVEIKTKVKISDIDDHIERMEKLRKVADLRNDKRKYLGAIAGVVFGDSEKTYALKKGFYVIEPSGDTFFITAPTGNYSPYEW